MSIKHIGPEEQDGSYAAAWRELKTRHSISRIVKSAGLLSIIFMIGNVDFSMLLFTCACAGAAICLSKRFVRAFRCPHCGHPFFNPKSSIDLVSARLCSNCHLKLWSSEGA